MINLSNYKTIIFDCDGVILNSNRIKTEAFRTSAFPWGERLANLLVDYHVANGGISRYQKFEFFIDTLIPLYLPDATPGIDGPGLNELLDTYSKCLRYQLVNCGSADGLDRLRQQTPHTSWCIVSGRDQSELRDVFQQRSLYHLFDGGIYGSPDTKNTILEREILSGQISMPAIFFGDSLYDYKASLNASIDFVLFRVGLNLKDGRILYLRKISASSNV